VQQDGLLSLDDTTVTYLQNKADSRATVCHIQAQY